MITCFEWKTCSVVLVCAIVLHSKVIELECSSIQNSFFFPLYTELYSIHKESEIEPPNYLFKIIWVLRIVRKFLDILPLIKEEF
jgi:hypothetical protein